MSNFDGVFAMSDLEGVMLSDYLLLQCISKGGVADVYRARQNGEGNYEVAVKIFRQGYAQRQSFRDFFMAEAEKIGQFDHPNILPFLEFGEGEGLLYVVTPFIKTGTLGDLLLRVGGRFSAMQSLPIVRQLGDALRYCHSRDVIHGNLKPSNVFVGADGRMLLADFGIARGYDDSQQSLTRVGWGSAEYIAPEQSLGVLRQGSDQYSLAVLLFRVLTGQPPFSGQTPVEVLLKHVRQPPPSARLFAANVSDAVDAVLHKALQKRSDDRYPSVEAFCQAFEEAVVIAPVASPVARAVSEPVPSGVGRDPMTPVPTTLLSMSSAPEELLASQQPQGGNATPFPTLQAAPQVSQELSTEPPVSTAMPARTEAQEQQGPEPLRFWSLDPAEWSPLANEQVVADPGEIPLTASAYLQAQPAQAPVAALGAASTPPTAPPDPRQLPRKPGRSGTTDKRWKRTLPLAVVALLLLGLLAALLSPLLFPNVSQQNDRSASPTLAGSTAVPTLASSPTSSPASPTTTATPGAKKTPVGTATALPPRPTPNPPGGPPVPTFSCTTGSVTLDGSANFQPAVQQLTNDYTNQCSGGANFQVNANGSKASLDSVANGSTDLAYSDLSSSGRATLVSYPVAALVFAVIANPDSGVKGLTTSQIQGIYSGAITNWSQVGGVDEPIEVITRPSDSAIRAVFEAYVLRGQGQRVSGTSLWFDSSSNITNKVAGTSGAISYIPLAAASASGIRTLALNGASPTTASVAAGTYSFWSVEHLYSNQSARGLALSLVSFCFTNAGLNDLAQSGNVPIRRLSSAVLKAHLPGPTI